MLAEGCPGQSTRSWDLLRTVLRRGLSEYRSKTSRTRPLQPDRFSLEEANARLTVLRQQTKALQESGHKRR